MVGVPRMQEPFAANQGLCASLRGRRLLGRLPGSGNRGGFRAQLLLEVELLEPGRQNVLLRTAPILVMGIARASRNQPPSCLRLWASSR